MKLAAGSFDEFEPVPRWSAHEEAPMSAKSIRDYFDAGISRRRLSASRLATRKPGWRLAERPANPDGSRLGAWYQCGAQQVHLTPGQGRVGGEQDACQLP